MRKKLEKLFAEFDEAGREISSTTKEALLLIAAAIGTPPDAAPAADGVEAPTKATVKKSRPVKG